MKPQIVFFTELLGPSLIINLAQLVSPSVALPAELVLYSQRIKGWGGEKRNTKDKPLLLLVIIIL